MFRFLCTIIKPMSNGTFSDDVQKLDTSLSAQAMQSFVKKLLRTKIALLEQVHSLSHAMTGSVSDSPGESLSKNGVLPH